jgi:hypothetical protein
MAMYRRIILWTTVVGGFVCSTPGSADNGKSKTGSGKTAGAGLAPGKSAPTKPPLPALSALDKATIDELSRISGVRVDVDPKSEDVVVTSKTFTDGLLKKAASIRRLRRISIGNSKTVTDAGVKSLFGHPGLVSVSLVETSVTDACTKTLASIPELDNVNLSRTGIASGALVAFHGNKSLTFLNLSHTAVDDAALASFAFIHELRDVNLTGTRVTDKGLPLLSRAKKLDNLNLSLTRVTDAGLKAVAAVPTLTTLNLRATKVTSAGMKHLASGAAPIGELILTETTVGDKGLATLSASKSMRSTLHTLVLKNAKVTDAGMGDAAKLPLLGDLDVSFTAVTDAGLKKLEKSKLAVINVQSAPVTPTGVAALMSAVPRIVVNGKPLPGKAPTAAGS